MIIAWMLATVFAQNAGLFGDLPEEAQSFRLQTSSGEAYYVFRANREWVKDLTALADNQTVEVFPDTPWSPVAQPETRLARNLKSAEQETSTQRKQRLQAGWAREHTFVVSAAGERPVKTRDLEYAQRADAMQQEVLDRIYPAVTHTVAAPQESGPGFLERWGGHIFLVLLALALAAVVVKTLILEED